MPKLIRSLIAVICLSTMPLVVSALAQVPAPTNAPANTDRDIDINAIVQRSAHVTEADREASSEYEFSETDWEPNGSHRTYAVHMLYGSPYRQLIAIDGNPLPKDKQQEQERKLREEIVRRAHESPKQHARRIAEQEKENTRDPASSRSSSMPFVSSCEASRSWTSAASTWSKPSRARTSIPPTAIPPCSPACGAPSTSTCKPTNG